MMICLYVSVVCTIDMLVVMIPPKKKIVNIHSQIIIYLRSLETCQHSY